MTDFRRVYHTFESTGTIQLNQRQTYLDEGVYAGYDFPVVPPSDLFLKLEMGNGFKFVDDTAPINQEIVHGLAITKQRMYIAETDASMPTIEIQPTNATPRIDAIILQHSRILVFGGNAPIYKTVDTLGITDPDAIRATLGTDEVLLGILELPINCTGLDQVGVNYTKVQAKNFKRNATLNKSITAFDDEQTDGIIYSDSYPALNAPPFSAGQTNPVLLEVFAVDGKFFTQRATDAINSNEVFTRYYNGTSWGAWQKVTVDIVNDLVTNDPTKALGADQGVVILGLITALDGRVTANEGNITILQNDKANKSDIVNNLTTNDPTKILGADQGVVIQALINALDGRVTVNEGDILDIFQDILDIENDISNIETGATKGILNLSGASITSEYNTGRTTPNGSDVIYMTGVVQNLPNTSVVQNVLLATNVKNVLYGLGSFPFFGGGAGDSSRAWTINDALYSNYNATYSANALNELRFVGNNTGSFSADFAGIVFYTKN